MRPSTSHCIHLLFPICYSVVVAFSVSPSAQRIHFLPSTLICQSLTHSYPISIFDKLFTSAPRREYAIQDISLSFGLEISDTKGDVVEMRREGLHLFVGSSGCGKSTVLKIICGEVKQDSGHIILNEPSSACIGPKPVMIESKPTDLFDEKHTVLQRIIASADEALDCHKAKLTSTFMSKNDIYDQSIKHADAVIEILSREFAATLDLTDDQIRRYPKELSPSGQYLFGLACACMRSSSYAALAQLQSTQSYNHESTLQKRIEESNMQEDHEGTLHVPCPIILLDELLENETPAVAKKVGSGLRKLVDQGGLVLAATHRPEHLRDVSDRVIRFSAGKVLSTST